MTLDEFIEKVFKRYVCASDTDEKKEEYASTLFELCGKVDFEKLLDVISRNNEKDFVPSASNVLEWSKSCYKTEYKKGSGGWVHVKMKTPPDFGKKYGNGGNIDVFPSGWSEEKILNYYQKRFGGEGWRIEELRYA